MNPIACSTSQGYKAGRLACPSQRRVADIESVLEPALRTLRFWRKTLFNGLQMSAAKHIAAARIDRAYGEIMVKVMEGVRILEIAQFTFVPVAGAVLADWGADVIKIEHPVRGDTQRGFVRLEA